MNTLSDTFPKNKIKKYIDDKKKININNSVYKHIYQILSVMMIYLVTVSAKYIKENNEKKLSSKNIHNLPIDDKIKYKIKTSKEKINVSFINEINKRLHDNYPSIKISLNVVNSFQAIMNEYLDDIINFINEHSDTLKSSVNEKHIILILKNIIPKDVFKIYEKINNMINDVSEYSNIENSSDSSNDDFNNTSNDSDDINDLMITESVKPNKKKYSIDTNNYTTKYTHINVNKNTPIFDLISTYKD